MSATTTNEGYPYPLTSDFADVQDFYRLATAVDVDLFGVQTAFRNFAGRPAFITRQSANAGGFISGSQSFVGDVIEWDSTPGGLVAGRSYWAQQVSQQPTWWMFGGDILVAVISGTPVVGDMNLGELEVFSTDQVSGLTAATSFWQRQDETNTGGERINVIGFAPVYRGQVLLNLRLNGSTQKSIGAGSRFWGMQLGPVV